MSEENSVKYLPEEWKIKLTITIREYIENYVPKINLNPVYQRDHVWDIEKRINFLEELLNGYCDGRIYLSKIKNVYNCIDGKQRTRTFQQFNEGIIGLMVKTSISLDDDYISAINKDDNHESGYDSDGYKSCDSHINDDISYSDVESSDNYDNEYSDIDDYISTENKTIYFINNTNLTKKQRIERNKNMTESQKRFNSNVKYIPDNILNTFLNRKIDICILDIPNESNIDENELYNIESRIFRNLNSNTNVNAEENITGYFTKKEYADLFYEFCDTNIRFFESDKSMLKRSKYKGELIKSIYVTYQKMTQPKRKTESKLNPKIYKKVINDIEKKSIKVFEKIINNAQKYIDNLYPIIYGSKYTKHFVLLDTVFKFYFYKIGRNKYNDDKEKRILKAYNNVSLECYEDGKIKDIFKSSTINAANKIYDMINKEYTSLMKQNTKNKTNKTKTSKNNKKIKNGKIKIKGSKTVKGSKSLKITKSI